MSEAKTTDLSVAISRSQIARTSMDPRLQLELARRRVGFTKLATASTDEDEVAVLARVSDSAAWERLSEVRSPAVVGTIADGTVIVTGRIPIGRIEAVRADPTVQSLKAAFPLRPELAATLEETGARADLLPAGSLAAGGRGCIVGVVDYGGDFTHRSLRRADGTSRLLAIWDQGAPATPTSPFGYGREHRKAAIDLALQAAAPEAALGYSVQPAPNGTHGTHVLDIAAGSGLGSGVPGVAPEADLVFVDVSHADIPFQGAGVVGVSFGDSVRLLEAIKYVFDVAGARPCVVNVSLGTNGGPHDGTTLVERGIDALIRAAPGRAVTLAASNSYDDGIHAAGTVAQGQVEDLPWRLASSPATDVELEVWYEGADRFTVELLGPDGASLAVVPPGGSATLQSGTDVAVFVANRLDDPNNHDNMIGVFLAAGVPAGTYTVRLRGDLVTSGAYHAWIERDNRMQSHFELPKDGRCTLGSVSCGELPIVVGSYDAHKAALPLSYFSSAGPSRDGRHKPDVSAPGHAVLAAKSGTGTGTVRKSGTSMAAPAVAGIVALVLSEAAARGVALQAMQIRDLVLGTARRSPPPGAAWDERYGVGRVSAAEAVRAAAALGPPPPAPPPTTTPPAPAERTRREEAGASRAGRPPAGPKPRPAGPGSTKRRPRK